MLEVKGYNNKVLIVNLTTGEMEIEEPGERFYRMYLGGTGLGCYYCMRDIPKGADPLGPDNVLVLSTGVATGAPVMGASRLAANAKSPVTGGIGDAQGGGYWGVAFKWAGFDAVVIKGKAEKPVYLFVQDGKCEIRDASHIWGMTTKDYEAKLREEISKDVVVAGIGPAGEKLNKYACIINERKHANGRTGMGCVMGSKNLKCVAAIGKKPKYEYHDIDTLRKYAKFGPEFAKTSAFYEALSVYGTNGDTPGMNEEGMLPTHNFEEGFFPEVDGITSETMNEKISIGTERCYMCSVACKRHVAATKEKDGFDIDPAYGGPEYETVATFGSYLDVDDIVAVSKCNEICNAYGMDTISVGSEVAFAMKLFEVGILKKEDYNFECKFGDGKAAVELTQMIADRVGLGDVLAEGMVEAARIIGKGAEHYAVHCKNNPHPAHMPQTKSMLSVHYATNPFGSDHMTLVHDPSFGPGSFEDGGEQNHYATGIYTPIEENTQLTEHKMKLLYYSELFCTLTDGLCVCMFTFLNDGMYSMTRTTEIVKAVTGWDTSLWEIMKAAERIRNLQRLFNQREGFSKKDDFLPDEDFKPFTRGPLKGCKVDKEKLDEMIDLYYDMVGWDTETGNPKRSKIVEMELQWAADLL